MQKTTLLLAVALAFSASSWGQDVKINGTGVSLEANKTPIHTAKNPQAIALLPQDLHLAVPGTPQRPQFQRLLVWLVANVYPTFTYADYPERWAPAAAEQLVENCRQYRKNLYLWFEQQLAAGPWALGASVTLLDCYIAAMYRWGPRQAWFDDHAPKFAAIARAVCQRPELAAALRRNKLI